MSGLERRLNRLETTGVQRKRVIIWRDVGRTAEEVVAERFPHGVPDHFEVLTIGWKEPE
jgi:hypothetical protein